MPIYLGAEPNGLFLADEKRAVKFSVPTAILLRAALTSLLDDPETEQGQVAHLWLFRVGEQVGIADQRTIIFLSAAGVRNIIAELLRYITIASALSCACKSPRLTDRPPVSARSRNGQPVRRPN